MRRLLLFPLNEDTKVLVKNAEKCRGYQIIAISSYREDKEKLKQYQKGTLIFCNVNFEECLNRVDTVLFADNTMNHEVSGYKERVLSAIEHGHDIFISDSLLSKLEIERNKKNIFVLQNNNYPEEALEGKLKEISIPVLSIMGLGKNCGKFELQTIVQSFLEKKGYNVLAICSNPLGRFINMEIFPAFCFSKVLSLQTKIEAFNMWIYKLQEKIKADVILLGYPGGILPLNELEPNHYGEVPLLVSNAIIPDSGILALYRTFDGHESTMKKLDNLCQTKYNTAVKKFVVSKNYYSTDYEGRKVNYYHDLRECEVVNNKLEKKLYNITTIEDEIGLEKQINEILTELENNFFSI